MGSYEGGKIIALAGALNQFADTDSFKLKKKDAPLLVTRH